MCVLLAICITWLNNIPVNFELTYKQCINWNYLKLAEVNRLTASFQTVDILKVMNYVYACIEILTIN